MSDIAARAFQLQKAAAISRAVIAGNAAACEAIKATLPPSSYTYIPMDPGAIPWPTEPAARTPARCDYCGTLHGGARCDSCGAPR